MTLLKVGVIIQYMITLENKPIFRITKKFDRTISSLIIGDDKEHLAEYKNIGVLDEYVEYINKNANDESSFLLELDEKQWVCLSKEGFLK